MAATEDFEGLSCTDLIRKLLELFETNQEDDVDECLDWFLFTYSPEHAPSDVLSNKDALKDPILLHLIMTKVKDIYEPEIFLETMNVISYIEGYEQDIAQAGAVRSVISMMNRDSLTPRSQALGCKVLANLSNDAAVRAWIGKVKGVGVVIEALKRHQQNIEISFDACRALTNIAYRCPSNKETIVTEHGIETILDSMVIHKTNVKFINTGLRALRNIIPNKMVMELQQHRITHEVALAMGDYKAISDIQVNAIWILVGLTSGRSELKRHVLDHSLDHLLQAMDTHKSDQNVQLAGATALALLSKLTANRMVISGSRGIPLLVTTLHTHLDSVPILRATIKALFRLSCNKVVREKLITENIIQQIIKAMKVHPEHGPLQRISIIFLLQLAKAPTLRTTIQQDAASYILQARNRFETQPHIRSVAVRALEWLVISGEAVAGDGEKNDQNLVLEVKQAKSKMKEKERLIKKLMDQRGHLEIEVEALREAMEEGNEDPGRRKKELAKLQQQKEALVEDIKKAESCNREAYTELESLKSKLKEEQKKLGIISSDRPDEDKKRNEINMIVPIREGGREGGGRESGNKKRHSGKTSAVKGSVPTPGVGTTVPTPGVTKDKKPTNDSGKKSIKSENTKKTDTTTEPLHTSNSPLSDIMIDGIPLVDKEGKPRLERSRSLSRHVYASRPSFPQSNDEPPNQLSRTLEALSKKLEEKQKELVAARDNKARLEALAIKLNVDLKGAQILVQTLQKENQTQVQIRDKVSTDSGSVFVRHQKKIKAYKNQLGQLESENSELKKELQALKKRKKK